MSDEKIFREDRFIAESEGIVIEYPPDKEKTEDAKPKEEKK